MKAFTRFVKDSLAIGTLLGLLAILLICLAYPTRAHAQTFIPPIPENGPIPQFNVPGTLTCDSTPFGIQSPIVTDEATCLGYVKQYVTQSTADQSCYVIGWELSPNGTATQPATDYRLIFFENNYGQTAGECIDAGIAFDFAPNIPTNTATECPPTAASDPWLGNPNMPNWILAEKSVPISGVNGAPTSCACQSPITLPFFWGTGNWNQHWNGALCTLTTPFDFLFTAPRLHLGIGAHAPIFVPTDPYNGIAEVGFQADSSSATLTVSSGTNGSTTNLGTVTVTSVQIVDANTGAPVGAAFTQQSTCPSGGGQQPPCFAGPLSNLTNGGFYSIEIQFSASSIAPDQAPLYLDVTSAGNSYTFLVTTQYPQFNSGVVPSGAMNYGPDNLTFTLGNYSYPNGNTWNYDDSKPVSITVEGVYRINSCGVRCVPTNATRTTMPQSDGVFLMGFDANGIQIPATDLNGKLVALTYSPLNGIDRWVAIAQLAPGSYFVGNISGTSCETFYFKTGQCGAYGGTQWNAVFHASYNFVAAPPAPCDSCDRPSLAPETNRRN